MELFTVIKAKSVEDDLEEIARFIAEDNPYKALSFVKEILRDAESALSLFPTKFKKYKECHVWPYKGYLVFYDVNHESKTVQILLITHSAQFNKYKHFIDR